LDWLRAKFWSGLGLGFAAAYQLQQFLRRRLVAVTAVAALLRHRAAAFCRFRSGLTRFAGRGLIANIDVATAHDC
jgi:hypothetical protein